MKRLINGVGEPLTFRLTKNELDRLDVLCFELDCSRSQALRFALDSFIGIYFEDAVRLNIETMESEVITHDKKF